MQNIIDKKYNYKETRSEDWQKTFRQEMERNRVFLQDLDTNRFLEDMNKDVELITEVMKTITDKIAKERKALEKARSW